MLKSLFIATVAMAVFFAMLTYSILKTQEIHEQQINTIKQRVDYWFPEEQPEGKK